MCADEAAVAHPVRGRGRERRAKLHIGHQDLVLQGWVGRAVACLVCRSENRPKKGSGTAGEPVTAGAVF